MAAGEDLLKRYEKAKKFGAKYGIIPNNELKSIYGEMARLATTLPESSEVRTRDELLQRELRGLLLEQMGMVEEHMHVSATQPGLGTLIEKYQIPVQDIMSIHEWLVQNRTATLYAIDRLYETREVEGGTFHIDTDPRETCLVWNIPHIQKKIVSFAEKSVERYHTELGALMAALTNAGESLETITVTPTSEGRPYFDSSNKILAMSIHPICLMDEGGELHLDEQALIGIYGHEIGHVLNTVLTSEAVQDGNIPYFLGKRRLIAKTTQEAIAQFYGKQILEDLRSSPQTQQALGIESHFEDIYEEVNDTELLTTYNQMLSAYCLIVLHDNTFGDDNDPETAARKLEALKAVELVSGSTGKYVRDMCREYRPEQLSEMALDSLLYCSKPVERALRTFEEHGILYSDPEGRSLIDRTFLTGYWTAQGFEDNARLVAEAHSKR